jgi:hypothetical protein
MVISAASLIDFDGQILSPNVYSIFFPLMVTAAGIIVCLLTSIYGGYFVTIDHP